VLPDFVILQLVVLEVLSVPLLTEKVKLSAGVAEALAALNFKIILLTGLLNVNVTVALLEPSPPAKTLIEPDDMGTQAPANVRELFNTAFPVTEALIVIPLTVVGKLNISVPVQVCPLTLFDTISNKIRYHFRFNFICFFM
jgi:hypothetical protein